jgi:Chaperone of endosialidase
MALVLYDRVQQTGTANTTVSFTLSGSVTGFQSFAVVGNGNTTYYSATDASGNWEVGIGTYATGGTLTRTTILSSSNSGSAVTFSGTVNVFVTYPSGKSVNLDASGNATSLGTPASFVATNVTGLPISTGVSGLGTNVATALAVAVGSAGAFVTFNGALGTPSSGTVTNLTGTASININGTVGATTASTGAFTSLSDSGNLDFTGISNRITGDFSNATVASRVMFQTNTTNGITRISAIPNGSGAGSIFTAYGATDPTNSGTLSFYQNASASAIIASITGTGTYTPLTFTTNGSERLRIFTSGGVSIGNTTDPGATNLSVTGSVTAVSHVSSSDERLKTNWSSLDLNFVSCLADIKHGTFERISSGNREVGVSAQSLQTLIPEAVIEGGDGMLSVNYGAAALVAAIELAKEVKALRAEIAQLKAK